MNWFKALSQLSTNEPQNYRRGISSTILRLKSQRWDLNPQPPHYECDALPIEATLAFLRGDAGGLSVWTSMLFASSTSRSMKPLPCQRQSKELSPTYLVTIVRIPHQTTVPKRNSIPENTLKTCISSCLLYTSPSPRDA